jgi:type II secretory ATPase GspE/PulE/Tfp pilus assembly ATPase PilB-like protein
VPGQAGSFTELGQFLVHPASVRLLEHEFCLEHLVVVLGDAGADPGAALNVGMVHPHDATLCAALADRLGREVIPVGLNPAEVHSALAQGYDTARAARGSSQLQLAATRTLTMHVDDDAVHIVSELLGYAVTAGASDLHLECYEDDVDVRLRIDGVLAQRRTPLSPHNLPRVIGRLKVLARLDVTERRRAQDGRIMARYTDAAGTSHDVDFRLSVTPGPYGEDAVLRVMNAAAPMVALTELGLPAGEHARLSALLRNPEGLILVTGPTGSGKTTTLYSAIHHINTAHNKILTVEDPIEFQFDKVNQKQISPQMGFADYARAFMRQNPDVILIGEIRDEDTADAVLRAAQTGHLVLSTLHTIDATRTVTRLRTLGVDADLLGATLLCAISQRLARKVCAHCAREQPPSEVERERLQPEAGASFQRGAGCTHCAGSGTRGRVGLFEVFVPDADLAQMIMAGAPVQSLRAEALARGMRSLFQDAMDKARAGVIPLSEVLRVVPYRMLGEAAGSGAPHAG